MVLGLILWCGLSLAAPTLVEQWLIHGLERRQWRDSLSEPSRHQRTFDQRYESTEREKTARRITDQILRNTVQDLIQLSAPQTVARIKGFSERVANQRTVLSESNESPSEFRYGYHLFEDTARAEWLTAHQSFGLQLENVMVWDDSRRIVRVRCFGEQRLDSEGTWARASYSSWDHSVILAVSRPISRDVSARLELISLLRGDARMAFSQASFTFVIQNTSL